MPLHLETQLSLAIIVTSAINLGFIGMIWRTPRPFGHHTYIRGNEISDERLLPQTPIRSHRQYGFPYLSAYRLRPFDAKSCAQSICLHVVVDGPSLLHSCHDCGKVIICKDLVCDILWASRRVVDTREADSLWVLFHSIHAIALSSIANKRAGP